MNWPIGISLTGLVLTLLVNVGGGLLIVWKVSGIFHTMLSTIDDLKKEVNELKTTRAAIDAIPLLRKDLEVMRAFVDEHSRKLSDFPRMRERLDSIQDDVKEASLGQLSTRVAVLEQKTRSGTQYPAVRPPRPGKDDDR